MILEFQIPLLPKTPNSIGKQSIWSSHNERHKWRQMVGLHSKHHINKSKLNIALPFPKANLILTRCSSREPDIDNLYASFKYVIDGLKFNGIIVDDKPSLIDLKCLWVKTKPKDGHIILRIEERYE